MCVCVFVGTYIFILYTCWCIYIYISWSLAMSQYWHPWVLRFEPASVRDRPSQVRERNILNLFGKNVKLMQNPGTLMTPKTFAGWCTDLRTLMSWCVTLTSQRFAGWCTNLGTLISWCVTLTFQRFGSCFLGCWNLTVAKFHTGKIAFETAVGKKNCHIQRLFRDACVYTSVRTCVFRPSIYRYYL